MLNRRNTTILVAVCLALFPAVAQAQSYGAEAIGSALPSLMLIILSVMVGGGLLTIATYLLWHHFRGPLNHKFVASVGGCVLPSVTNLVGALAIFYALFEPSANMNELLVVIGVPIWAIGNQLAYITGTIFLMREDKPGADSPPEPPTATSRDHATNSGPNDVSPGQIAPAPPKSSSNKGGIVSRIGGTIFRALLCALGVLVCLLGEVAFMVSGWVAIVVVGGVLTNGVNAATAGIGPLMVATTTTAILTATGLAMVVAAFWNRKPEDSSADAPSAETRAQT